MSISQCTEDIRRYKRLKANLVSIVQDLSFSEGKVSSLNNVVKDKYKVNDSNTAIVSKISNLFNNLDETKLYINNVIIPAIDSSTSNLYKLKDKLIKEEQERLEQERQDSEDE